MDQDLREGVPRMTPASAQAEWEVPVSMEASVCEMSEQRQFWVALPILTWYAIYRRRQHQSFL